MEPNNLSISNKEYASYLKEYDHYLEENRKFMAIIRSVK